MEAPTNQVSFDLFVAQVLERHTKRAIAGILSDIEDFTQVKDQRRSQIVKDYANMAKRMMLTKLTGLEVESNYADPGRRIPHEEASESDS